MIEHRDRPVTRDEIVQSVWRGVNVGDNNLPVQVHSLRRVLEQHGGGELIITVPHRGYRFVGEIDPMSADQPAQRRPGLSLEPIEPPTRYGGDVAGTAGEPSGSAKDWRDDVAQGPEPAGPPGHDIRISGLRGRGAMAVICSARRAHPVA